MYTASAGAYLCEAIPNQQALCSYCNERSFFCGPGLLCNEELGCTRFCCVDSDCPIGPCTLDAFLDDDVAAIGYCVDEALAVCTGTDAGTVPSQQ